jgi:hypothetical protein
MDIEKFEMTQKVPCSDMLDGVAPRTSPLQPAATGHWKGNVPYAIYINVLVINDQHNNVDQHVS